MTIHTDTVTVEVDLEIRRGEDSDSDGFSFDPMAQTLVEGTVGEMPVSAKLTHVRDDQQNAEILTELGDGGISTDSNGVGVFLPMDAIINAAIHAVKEDPDTELPDSYESSE